MKLYRLPFVLHSPSEETEDKYLAEIPALPGCRAWGDTPGQALEYLQSVATAFIESYRERGDSLPEKVRLAAQEVETGEALGEVMVGWLNYRELTRKLRRLGCAFERQAKGDHEVWINTTNNQRTTIPNWAART